MIILLALEVFGDLGFGNNFSKYEMIILLALEVFGDLGFGNNFSKYEMIILLALEVLAVKLHKVSVGKGLRQLYQFC